ncbi:hypothetical protein CFAM422_007229 [Trichoderma lentiforme]|uniref:Uncharacterized protein n=1 Tax=Trichoderma lentiforme TaxID=1567552 RepID=A0A9P4XEI4_9HYPO|nr:hypothetical protein CFAM422_007229 [Trichoderma lentiforme]
MAAASESGSESESEGPQVPDNVYCNSNSSQKFSSRVGSPDLPGCGVRASKCAERVRAGAAVFAPFPSPISHLPPTLILISPASADCLLPKAGLAHFDPGDQ